MLTVATQKAPCIWERPTGGGPWWIEWASGEGWAWWQMDGRNWEQGSSLSSLFGWRGKKCINNRILSNCSPPISVLAFFTVYSHAVGVL